MPAFLFSILAPLFLPSSSVSLSHFILAVPMRECLGKHSCMSSQFSMAILNGIFLLYWMVSSYCTEWYLLMVLNGTFLWYWMVPSYGTEWYLLISRNDVNEMVESRLSKTNYIIINIIFVIFWIIIE